MSKNQSVLFPFYLYNKEQILMILSIFSKVTIYKPWYAEDNDLLKDQAYSDYIRLLNPPIERKPKNNFKDLLPEYFRWMMEHPDRTVWESLKNYHKSESGEEKIWAIRKIIRNVDQDLQVRNTDKDFERHLILHLAQEIEKHRMEVDNRIGILKEKGSILEGVIEEINQDKDLLSNLQSFKIDRIMEESHLAYVIESWFALFGDSLSGSEPLITFERPVFDLIKEGFIEMRNGDNSARIILHETEFPNLSTYELNEVLNRKKRDPLKRIINNFLIQLQELDLENKTPFSISNELSGKEKELGVSSGRLHLEIMYFSLSQDEGHSRVSRIVTELNQRIIIHLKQVS